MFELQYMKQGRNPDVAKAPILRGQAEVFELTTFENVTKGNSPLIRSTISIFKGKYPKGSNQVSQNAWDHFNYDLLDRIRATKDNDESNLRAI
jgi:hypothetical protein